MTGRPLHRHCAAAVLFAALVFGVPVRAQTSAEAAHAGPASPLAARSPTTSQATAQAAGAPIETAQKPPASASPLGREGGNVWSVFFGYGFNQEVYDSATGIDIATAGLRWSRLWEAKGSSFLRGHPGLGLELVPVMSFVESGRSTWALGANLLYEHHFAVAGRVLPTWKIGAGLVYATRPVPQSETRRNFSVLSDLGVDITVTESSAMYIGYRFHHVSNAGTGRLNPGINVHSVIFGLSFYR